MHKVLEGMSHLVHEPAVFDCGRFFRDALHLFLDKLNAAFAPLFDLVC